MSQQCYLHHICALNSYITETAISDFHCQHNDSIIRGIASFIHLFLFCLHC